MNADELLQDIAEKLRTSSDLDPEVIACVIDSLVLRADPMKAVETVEITLHTLAMRRAAQR